MINPEFQRNLWLQFSWHRVVAMPALLGLAFLAMRLADRTEGLIAAALTLFILIVCFWGTRNASAAITEEFRDKTWDQQRMSAMQPWAMTWGKLFGATSFNWYGGAVCLLVLLSQLAGSSQTGLIASLALVPIAILMHASALALNLHMSRIETRLVQRGGLGGLIILAAVMAAASLGNTRGELIQWWGLATRKEWFLLGSAALFAGCAVFAAWRSMCGALEVRTVPWAWPGFSLVLTVYAAGFHGAPTLATLCAAGMFVAGVMTYFALFTEASDIAVWRRVATRVQAGRWRDALEHLPLWPTTLVPAFVFAALATLLQTLAGADRADLSWGRLAADAQLLPLTLALMVLRDAFVFLFFAFADKPRRVEGTVMLYLVVINGLLPFLGKAFGVRELQALLAPLTAEHGLPGAALMALRGGFAVGGGGGRGRQRAAELEVETQKQAA